MDTEQKTEINPHFAHMRRVKPERECTAADMTFGDRCLNCGFGERIVTGTSYFPSRDHAARYYKPYAKIENPDHWLTELSQLVNRKIEAGEIHIGKPELKPGQRAFVQDNRWHIEGAR